MIYDAAGQLTQTVGPLGPRARAAKHTHDDAGRLVRINYFDKTFLSFTDGPDGCLPSATNEEGTISFERDALGRIVREEAGDFWVSSAYGPGGQRELMACRALKPA